MGKMEQDAIDARRWRAIRERHAVHLCRLATGSSSYSSDKTPGLLDAWADLVAHEVDAFDRDQWRDVELPNRISELKRELT
jgi:hypothetical protein